MRRRLTIAILGVVLGTLLLSGAASILLVNRAATETAENELTPQAQALGSLLSTNPIFTDNNLFKELQRVGDFDAVDVVTMTAGGQFSDLPSPLGPSVMDASALQDGETVSGNVGAEIFSAVPVSLTRRQLLELGLPSSETAVLVITHHVKNPVGGIGIFLLVAGVVLVIGAAVAAILARRISAPVLEAVSTTGEIARGDLSARVPVSASDYPELKELAESINQMGESLGRSQGLERQFLLSVSHELRTPLTSIRGYADAVADGTTDDVTGAVAIIGSEARRLERLVQDLLDLARLDARQFSFHPQQIDCADVVANVAVGFRPEARALGIDLSTQVPDGTELSVNADPDRLSQVVANLVENAFKFARSRVVVGTGTVGQSMAIWVSDDGPGIEPADLPHVFDRHFTSDRATARKLGTGLGLAIVAELTAAMASRCTAESPVADGRGTRMTVWLQPGVSPAKSPADSQDRGPAPTEAL